MAFRILKLGRFNARAVDPGDLLYGGMTHEWSREPAPYERDHTIIEIYDSRYHHSTLGQFVSSYGADTLAVFSGRQLSLQGDIPAWTMSPEETSALVAFARAEVARS
jgi:hypothetical protein